MTHEEFYKKLFQLSFDFKFNDINPSIFVDRVEALIKEAGYISTEECIGCRARYDEALKFETHEASRDYRDLQGEVKYWKDKNYELGGR